jgi:hypothetical protein
LPKEEHHCMRMIEPRTFRANSEAWLGQFLLPLVFFILLTITAVNRAGMHPAVGGLGLGLLILIVTLDYVLPMARNWIVVDSRSIEGSLNGRFFNIYWTEVLAAWVVESRRQRFLCIGTNEGTQILPLRFLDDQRLWHAVQVMVPPEALEEQAVKKLPDYREWAEKKGQVIHTDGKSHTVADHWLIQIIGWSGLTFLLFAAVKIFQVGNYASAALMIGLLPVCLFLLLNWGINELGPETVERCTMFGSWQIDWDQVRWIEVDPFGSVIVLVGEDSQLTITGPGVWSALGKNEALSVLKAQAESRRIPLRRTFWALLKFSRKTRNNR